MSEDRVGRIVRELVAEQPSIPTEISAIATRGSQLAWWHFVGYEHGLNVKVIVGTHVRAGQLAQWYKQLSERRELPDNTPKRAESSSQSVRQPPRHCFCPGWFHYSPSGRIDGG